MSILPENQFLIERDDVNHPTVSGNKLHKLRPNIQLAVEQGYRGILSFGGPYSNHLHALAWACKENGLTSIGVIRGELHSALTPTLRDCQDWGMVLIGMARAKFRQQQDILNQDAQLFTPSHLLCDELKSDLTTTLKGEMGPSSIKSEPLQQMLMLPEGGSNVAAIESLAQAYRPLFSRPEYKDVTHAVCATGTGATVAGLRLAAPKHVRVLGIQAVAEGSATMQRIEHWLGRTPSNLSIIAGHLGGFAKTNKQLDDLITAFEQQSNIPLDPVYTGKMVLQLSKMHGEGFFDPHDRVLLLHTGGLQGKRT